MSSLFKWRSSPTQDQFQDAVGRGADAWYLACLRITNNEDLARDAVQDALLLAWRKRAQYRAGARLETWIHRIVINSAIATIRRQARVDRFQLYDAGDETALSPDTEVSLTELNRDLVEALSLLSEVERVCFVLKHLEQWRLGEIADQLDSSVGSVKQALFRAVKKLRVSMTGLRD